MSKKKNSVDRNVALGYIRQSYTRDEDDTNSPERQKSNIQKKCIEKGWEVEWYEDVGGHKSGRYVKNRPQWLALEKRLKDPDVVALVANDLSRLHRKGSRVSDLVDELEAHNVALTLAAPGRDLVDTSTPQGKLFLQFNAIIDEYYSADISQRAKDSIAHRKANGHTIGRPPFGTTRNDARYLVPSSEGAWLLPNGQFQAGKKDEKPIEGALWRCYYDCAVYMLEIYATGTVGINSIAVRLNEEGWPFRDRKGNPRTLKRDDVRRVVSNWGEYGGMVTDKKAKDRPGYENLDITNIPFNKERAVMPIPLLRKVAEVRQIRSIKPPDHGENKGTRVYPLSVITYCAHCEKQAEEQNNPVLRTALSGRTEARGTRRYRHASGVNCGCENKSVRCDIYEADFERLIGLLTVNQEAIDRMTDLAIQAANGGNPDDADLETQKAEAIALCNRKIDAAVNLYADGMIDHGEYKRRVESASTEKAHWEARTTETENAAIELALCLDAIDKLMNLWSTSDDKDRQALVRDLFEYLVYDLDMQRIVDFRLKPWADRFLVLRAALYDEDAGENEHKKYPHPDNQDEDTEMPHRGRHGRSFPCTKFATVFATAINYQGQEVPKAPLSDSTPTLVLRNTEIHTRFKQGESRHALAELFGITEQRVWQIVNHRRN